MDKERGGVWSEDASRYYTSVTKRDENSPTTYCDDPAISHTLGQLSFHWLINSRRDSDWGATPICELTPSYPIAGQSRFVNNRDSVGLDTNVLILLGIYVDFRHPTSR